MPDIHVPKLDSHGGGRSILKILLEVGLISVGVFLGLAGERWRERSHQRELAEQTLRRFRTEILQNRKAVAEVKEYHVTLQKELATELRKPEPQRKGEDVHFNGIRPASFDHAAWDLALGTQSLAYMDADLALALSTVYNVQERYAELTRGLLQAMYIAPPVGDRNSTFFGAVLVYFGDVTLYEPRLLHMYDDLLPMSEKALGEKPAEKR
jgi:hypothetical protein